MNQNDLFNQFSTLPDNVSNEPELEQSLQQSIHALRSTEGTESHDTKSDVDWMRNTSRGKVFIESVLSHITRASDDCFMAVS